MPEMKFVDFKPKWMKNLSEEDRRILEDTPATGSIPEGPPRIVTSIVPRGGLSAKALGETIELTQTIVNYAGHDVYHGFNPDFADLRSAKDEVFQLARLTVEPFEEGSFVIPARLDAPTVEVPDLPQHRKISTQDVVNRFDAMLACFHRPQEAAAVSIGAIQAVEALGRLLRREAQSITYASFDLFGRPMKAAVVDEGYVAKVGQARQFRQPTQGKLETLTGRITALDMVRGTLQLSIPETDRRVKGTFSLLYQPSLVECLGRHVRLQGYVERKQKFPMAIQVVSADILDSEG